MRMRECLARARALDHPVTLVMALNFAATFYQDRGEIGLLREIEDERARLATEHGLPLFLYLGEIHLGWLDCTAGHADDGIALSWPRKEPGAQVLADYAARLRAALAEL